MNKELYSIAGLFNRPDDLINAVNKVESQGYKAYDVNTPYPVHGMDRAMKLKPSTLSYVALVFGLAGAILGLLTMGWIFTVDYPLVIGGKPYFPLPAFIPITFEVTVLLASIATVIAMLFVYFKLPNNRHPLHDTDYMKQVSNDKFGINIQAVDPLFDEAKVKDFLGSLGAQNIMPIYYEEDEFGIKYNIFEPKFLGFLAGAFILTALVTYLILNYLLFMPPYMWMAKQEKLNPQGKAVEFRDGYGMRNPVEGTVARGYLPYPYKGNQAEASKYLINPLIPTIEVLNKGRDKFNTFCSPCHGYFGKGDSRLRGQFPAPPSLQSEKVRNYRDGDIYHIITEGQNIMPSYAKQITREERWGIILYLRALQRSQNAKETKL